MLKSNFSLTITYGGVTSHCLGWLMFMELLSFWGVLRDIKIQLLTNYYLWRCYISLSWMVNVYGVVIILMWPSVVGRMLKSSFSLNITYGIATPNCIGWLKFKVLCSACTPQLLSCWFPGWHFDLFTTVRNRIKYGEGFIFCWIDLIVSMVVSMLLSCQFIGWHFDLFTTVCDRNKYGEGFIFCWIDLIVQYGCHAVMAALLYSLASSHSCCSRINYVLSAFKQ